MRNINNNFTIYFWGSPDSVNNTSEYVKLYSVYKTLVAITFGSNSPDSH